LPKEPAYALVYYVAVVPCGLAALAAGWRPRLDMALGLALGLILWSCLTLIWGVDDGGRTGRFIRDGACTFGFVLVLMAVLGDAATRRRAAIVLVIGGALDASWAILLGYTLHDNLHILGATIYADYGRLHGWGVTMHPILGADAMALPYLTALYLGLAETRGRARLPYLAAALLMAVFIVMTESRGPLLAAGSATLFLCAWGPWRAGAFAGIAALGAGWWLTLPKAAAQHQAAAIVQRGTSHRLEIWRETLARIAERPIFGHGLAANLHLTLVGADETLHITFPHSMYLGLLFYGGAVGFVIFLALAGVVTLRLWRARAVPQWPWLAALWISTLLAALTDIGQVTKGPAPIWFIVWLPLGLILTAPRGRLLAPP